MRKSDKAHSLNICVLLRIFIETFQLGNGVLRYFGTFTNPIYIGIWVEYLWNLIQYVQREGENLSHQIASDRAHLRT